VPELEAEDASGERRWRRERESDTGIRERAQGSCAENSRVLGGRELKRVGYTTGKALIFVGYNRQK
jgi:hypothetical protein